MIRGGSRYEFPAVGAAFNVGSGAEESGAEEFGEVESGEVEFGTVEFGEGETEFDGTIEVLPASGDPLAFEGVVDTGVYVTRPAR